MTPEDCPQGLEVVGALLLSLDGEGLKSASSRGTESDRGVPQQEAGQAESSCGPHRAWPSRNRLQQDPWGFLVSKRHLGGTGSTLGFLGSSAGLSLRVSRTALLP